MSRIAAVALATLFLGVACAPPPLDTPETFEDGATLCADGNEVRAVFETCGSTCDVVSESSCTLDGSDISTTYVVTASSGDCDTSCAVVDTTCGTPDEDSLDYGDDPVSVSSLPDCSTLF